MISAAFWIEREPRVLAPVTIISTRAMLVLEDAYRAINRSIPYVIDLNLEISLDIMRYFDQWG